MPVQPERASRGTVKDFLGAFEPEIVQRNCKLSTPQKVAIKPQNIKGRFIAYASPESTFAVTKALFDRAEKSILIGIYDFTAGYMKAAFA
jgi:hypothetical protein